MAEKKYPYVTVVVEDLSRDDVKAVRDHLAKLPTTYTPLGAGAIAFVQACDKALAKVGKPTRHEPPKGES